MKSVDEFGEQIDRIDGLICGLDIPMPAEFHIKQMKISLKDLSDKLKQIYVEENGDNPWEF